MKKLLASILCLGLAAMALPKPFTPPAGKNLALGKKAAFLTPPDYQLCTDENDNIQLTDGKFDGGRMWWKKEVCVGWRNSDPNKPRVIKERPVGFTIDLGKVEPIQGFMYSTCGGDVGVTFPYYIYIYTSEDGKNWHFTGDLVKNSKKEYGAPPTDIFFVHKFASLKMPTKGRYVAFVMKANQYVFLDEIEFYRGDDALLANPLVSEPIKDLLTYKDKNYTAYQKRLINDINFIYNAKLPELIPTLEAFEKEIDALDSFDC